MPRELYRAGVADAHRDHRRGTAGGPGDRGGGRPAVPAGRRHPGVGARCRSGPANDTLVSLRAADQVLRERDWNSVVLVTDPWHAARSQLIAADLGLSAQVSSVTQGPATGPGVEERYVRRETLGTLFYLLTGGSSGAGSAVL